MGGKSTHVRHNKGNKWLNGMSFVIDLGINVVERFGKEVQLQVERLIVMNLGS